MKKIFLILVVGFLLVGAGVYAYITLPDGSKLLDKQEFSQLTNNQIKNYMKDNLQMTRYKVLDNKILVYYNLTYIEPTHKGTYRVFTQEKPFKISIQQYNYCRNITTANVCKAYLVDRNTPYYYILNESYLENVTYYNNVTKIRQVEQFYENGTSLGFINETYYVQEPYQVLETKYKITNTTILSTYYKAYQEQAGLFKRTKEFRDKAVNNILDELGALI